MKRSLCFLILMFAGSVNAAIINDFTGPYSASNWNITSAGDFTVDNSNPTNLTITTTNIGSSVMFDNRLSYETVAAETGTVSFDWTLDGFFLQSPAPFSAFTILVNGGIDSIVRSDDLDIIHGDTGHEDFFVTAGQTFGFEIYSSFIRPNANDSLNPNDRFSASIHNFKAPGSSAVSSPGTMLLIGLGIAMLGFGRRQL